MRRVGGGGGSHDVTRASRLLDVPVSEAFHKGTCSSGSTSVNEVPSMTRTTADARQADVIVVGAGPAGASAAYHLAEAGVDVLLLEKSAFPRDKVCGDGL